MKLIEADKVEQAIKDYWKAQVDRLPIPKNIEEHDAYANRLGTILEYNSDLLKEIEALPSIQPDTTTHDSIPAETGGNDEDRTSGDCISRQAAIDALLGITAMRNTIPLDSAIFNIKKLPSAQPERKTGRWLPDNTDYYRTRFICSVCGESEEVPTMGFGYAPMWGYCPNCGADMRGEKNG